MRALTRRILETTARVGAAGVVLVGAAAAEAQRLDFGQPQAPSLGEGSRLVELNAALASQIGQLRASGEAETARTKAALELRRLATVLLSDEDEPEMVLAGLTLAQHIETIDRLVLAEAGPASEAALILLARDAKSLADNPPLDADELRRAMRSMFAELLQVAPPVAGTRGWAAEPERGLSSAEFETIRAALAGSGLLTPLGEQSLEDLAALLDRAEAWHAFAPAAERTRGLIASASDAVLIAAAWLDAETRTRLGAELSAAVTGLREPDLRFIAQRRLRVLGEVGRVLAEAERLDSPRQAAAGLTALDAMLREQEPEQWSPSLRNALRVLGMANARQEAPAEAQFIRQLRPTWRWAMQRLRQTEGEALGVLDRAVRDPGALTDPAVVGALGAHQRSLEDLAGLIAINAMVTGSTGASDPAPLDSMRRLADAALAISRDLGHSRDGPDAIEAFRNLGAQAKQFGILPGEASLRSAASGPDDAWERLTGGKQAALVGAIDAARAEWLDGWVARGRPARGPEAPASLALLAELCATLHDGAMIEAMLGRPSSGEIGGSALNAWPGWELSRNALAALAEGMEEQLSETTRLALAGDASRVRERLRAFDNDHAALRVIAQLEREARRMGFVPAESPSAIVGDLASGAPLADAWLLDSREDLAKLSRWIEEMPGAKRRRDGQAMRQIREFTQMLAQDLQKQLDAGR